MDLRETSRLLHSLGADRAIALGMILWPVAAAFLAARRGRSVLIWTTVTFFMPLLAPFAMIPLCSVWHGLCGSYGVFDLLVRLLAGPACPAYLWLRRPARAPAQPAGGRAFDIIISLCFLAFLVFATALIAIAFFPAQH